MRMFKSLGIVLLTIILTLIFNNDAYSQQLKLSLEEIAQNSDLLFIGTVESQSSRLNEAQTMIFTDVLFKDIRVIHATNKSPQKGASEIKLTYAGGRFGNLSIEVSHTPVLLPGHRYLIFMVDDGFTYTSPIVGGEQGIFEVLTDAATKEEYLRTSSEKAVIGVDDNGIRLSKKRVADINAGSLIIDQAQNTALDGFFNEAATPSNPNASATVSNPNLESEEQQVLPLRLENFLDFIKSTSLKKRITNNRLKRDGTGVFYKRNGDKMEAEPIKIQDREAVRLSLAENNSFSSYSLSNSSGGGGKDSLEGGVVGACGYQSLFIVMEQISTSSAYYSVVNDNLFTWNQFMDIYRVKADDGSWGDNSTNEFGGFVDSDTLERVYGFRWPPGALAVTVTPNEQPQCSRITQSDVFWNPGVSWTNDADFAVGNGSVVLMRPTNQHETGHVWGLQRGPYTETYAYDVATVMQGYNPDVVEDGWGIHSTDANLIRRQYQNQTSILGTKDVGVESYYASNGLNNSLTDSSVYYPGQSIGLYQVTVENMSYTSVSDLRLRFYLSTNRTISTADYQLGSGDYWYWTTFPGETYNVSNYVTTIPTNIPPGQYYVGALVTINGFGNDDYTFNNSASFYYGPLTIRPSGSNGSGSAGLYNPSTSTFFLKNTSVSGAADVVFGYGPSGAGWTPIVGDWNGDGVDTVGLYNPSTSTFFLKNTNSAGAADLVFPYGPSGAGWKPIVGDWDGNGTDTVGLYNPSTSTFFLKNTNSAGAANLTFSYGPAGAGWTPLAGDWNGDSIDTVGLYNPSSSTFYLRNSNSAGVADTVFPYGVAGWKALAGDWNGDGVYTIGVYNPSSSVFYLKNVNSAGAADLTFSYGPAGAGWTPLVGDWDGF